MLRTSPVLFRFKKTCCFCFIFSFLLFIPDPALHAQKTIKAFPLAAAPVIDGAFDSGLWSGADSASGFVQMEPKPGESSSEPTSAWFGFDKENIYAVFKCYQHTPVIARNQSRDALSKNDDMVGLILDTYNDNRTGYGFLVNPLGTQIDFRINDDGNNMDLNWDTEWKCAAAAFAGGWCVEIKIPLRSLKFKKGLGTWGINFGRVIRSGFETSYWTGPLSNDFRISQGGKLTGMNTAGRMQLSLFPYISVFKTSGENIKADAGGDLKWQIAPNVSLNGTVNPDFATVEADQVQINLTRYELSYPEKRLFFQEGNEMYNTRFRTFYSRRIQDIDFGERLNGKIGGYQFNVVNVRTPRMPEDTSHYFFTAASVKRDFLKSSSIGLTAVDKSGDNSFTRSLSLDYNLNLGKTWYLTGQFVASAPGKDFWQHSAWFMRFARENNIYHYHIRYNNAGSSFRENVNQTGFITDDDRKEIDFEGTYKFWLKNNTFEYISVGSNNNIFWSQQGVLRSWNTDNSVAAYFSNRLSAGYSYNNEYKLFEKGFHNHMHEFTLGYNTEEWSHAVAGFSTGRNFDRDFNLYSAGFRVKPFARLSLQYSTSYLHFVPDPELNTTFINVVTANYNFTNDLWLKLFAQNSTANERVYVYGLVGWRFKPPFGALYLIYSHDTFESGEYPVKLESFFIKLTLPISIIK